MRVLFFLILTAWSAMAACTPPPNTWDYEAEKWRTNVVISGGVLSGQAYRAGTVFMQQVKWWGVRPKLGRVNLYLGSDTNAMQCPVIWDWLGGTVVNDDLVAFVDADYSETNGLTGNTSTKYLRCSKAVGLNLATFTDGQNIHFSQYNRTASDEETNPAGINTASGTWGLVYSKLGQTYIFMGALNTNVTDSLGIGFYLTSRTSSTNAATYRNTVTVATETRSDTASLGSVAMVEHAMNVNGSILANTSRSICFYGIGLGIPDTLVVPYYTAVQNVQIALGRQK